MVVIVLENDSNFLVNIKIKDTMQRSNFVQNELVENMLKSFGSPKPRSLNCNVVDIHMKVDQSDISKTSMTKISNEAKFNS